MFCQSCGSALKESGEFCPHCGKRRELTSLIPEKPKKSKWIKFTLALLVFVTLYTASQHFLKEDISLVVDEQLAAIRADRLTEAYYGFTSVDFQKAVSLEAFRKILKDHPQLTNNQGLKSYKDVIEGPYGLIKGELKSVDNLVYPIEYQLVKQENKWKILSFRVFDTTVADAYANKEPRLKPEESQELLKPIKTQLQALQKQDLDGAYEGLMSLEFISNTPLDVFKEFVESSPVIKDFESYAVEEEKIDHNLGTVVVVLKKGDEKMPVEYQLVKENEVWKIWGMRLLINGSSEANLSADELSMIIQSQLKTIEKGDIKQAYEEYTSKQFQGATSLDQFEKITKDFPAFHQATRVNASNVTFNNNVAVLNGYLAGEDNQKFPFEYDFIKENGTWKIVFMKIALDDSKSSDEMNTLAQPVGVSDSKLDFEKIVVGNEIDLNGIVRDPKEVLERKGGDFFANLYLNNCKKGDVVELLIRHVPTNSTLPPVTLKVAKDGESVLSYIFSPPAGGWPKGEYSIEVKASNGIQKVYSIKVE